MPKGDRVATVPARQWVDVKDQTKQNYRTKHEEQETKKKNKPGHRIEVTSGARKKTKRPAQPKTF